MVYTPKLVLQNKPYLVHDSNSSYNEGGFNSSTQWLRRRFEQSQENSFASEIDQSSPLLMRRSSGDNLTSRARSTGFQHLNTLYEQPASPTSTTTPTTPASSSMHG